MATPGNFYKLQPGDRLRLLQRQRAAVLARIKALPPEAFRESAKAMLGRQVLHHASILAAATLDGLRRTHTGAWTIYGRRFRTKALAFRAWQAKRRPRKLGAAVVEGLAPAAYDLARLLTKGRS